MKYKVYENGDLSCSIEAKSVDFNSGNYAYFYDHYDRLTGIVNMYHATAVVAEGEND